jgi:hypothetical protein
MIGQGPSAVDRGVMVRKYDSGIIGLGQTGRRRHESPTTARDTVELIVATAETGFVAVSRAVVSYAAEMLGQVERRVVGDANVRTAQGNAWDAICADRARAQARADMEAMVAALARDQRAVGSSPRSKASQAALVSTR